MNTKNLYIVTIGCQMNVYDSGQIRGILSSIGYSNTNIIENADLIIINTCSIRHKAEQKAFSFLGKIAKLKRKKPSLIVGVGGCLAQQEGKNILKRIPYVDLIFGSDSFFRLDDLISRIESSKQRIIDINLSKKKKHQYPFFTNQYDVSKVSAFVTIMRGCDNYCTYCIVPYVRGSEHSLNPERIVNEIKTLVSYGVKEVVLLGQNVNSYGIKNEFGSFTQLLKKVNAISGLERIRFTTSNPKDLSDDLINMFQSTEKLCNHIHLPVQSGDNTILKQMNRKYNIETYIEKVKNLRHKSLGISVTSDFIVGFPGESEQQFESTLNLIKTLRFDNSFAFSYSERPNTAASKFKNKIPQEVKQNRLQKLLKLQNSISFEINNSLVGNKEVVLVEGKYNKVDKSSDSGKYNISDKNIYYHGRTSSNRIVHFKGKEDGSSDLRGNIVTINIVEGNHHSLLGKIIDDNL